MDDKAHKLVPVTLPPDWAEAFRAAAAAEGVPLSRWLGEAGKKRLPADVRKVLSTPRERGRQAKENQ